MKRTGSSVKLRKTTTEQLVCQNSFQALTAVQGDEKMEIGIQGDKDRKADATSLAGDKVLVIGDSQVRFLKRSFCVRDRKRRIRECFPGTGFGDVSDRVEAWMAGEETKPIVCLNAGGNDVGRVGSEELFRRFRETWGKVRDKGSVPVVCGVLSTGTVGDMWQLREIVINCLLAKHCKANGWAFVDN